MSAHTSTAVPAEGRDAGVAWHYGDPFAEQRALERHAVVVDRSNRGVLTVPGEDRLPWLHSICSQHLSGLRDGDATQALVLSPNGHVEQHWQVTELDGAVWLDTEPGDAPTVLDYLTRMRFLKRVEPADVSSEWGVLTVAGPETAAVLTALGAAMPAVGRAAPLAGGGYVRAEPSGARAASGSGGAATLVVPATAVDAVRDRLLAAGAVPAGLWALEVQRVVDRVPRLHLETDHRTIPHEVGWIGSAVHLDKGCYRGQETVARVQNLGRPPRRLVFGHLSGESDELPPPGAPVEADGRAIGFLGTALHHHELGPVALAVVKRTVHNGAELDVAGVVLRVDE